MSNAWHLRNDGTAFPIQVHIYPMQDDNLASEAEVASFIINTKSKDQDYMKYVLDAFMALRIENSVNYDATEEDINSAIESDLNNLPFRFAYPLSNSEMIKIHQSQANYHDIDTLYDFIDNVRNSIEEIWREVYDSFNQQFCRVRYGGMYRTTRGSRDLYFRIASVGFNWDNVIYKFASDFMRSNHVDTITICRDMESDGSAEDYFYKAKDGSAYYMMPIEEFLSEEHESNPIFSSTDAGLGVIWSIRNELKKGNTIRGAYSILQKSGILCTRDYRPNFLNNEISKQCISASEWFDALNTRTKMKLGKVKRQIMQEYPEITGMDIDFEERENNRGNLVGFELLFTLESSNDKINGIVISVVSTRALSQVLGDRIVQLFRNEYDDYIDYMKIRI